VREGARPLLNRLAEYAYVNMVTKSRRMTLWGRVRFDIGPGSSVEVKLTEEKFVEQVLGATGMNSVFGQVQTVSHIIDAQAAQARTGFTIGWLRTPAENMLDGTSVEDNPLWSMPWLGCPNVEGFDPDPLLPVLLGWGQ
jgi:hypothetical protein